MWPFKRKLREISVRKYIRVTFDKLWSQYVRTVEISQSIGGPPEVESMVGDGQLSGNEKCEYDETQAKRKSFYDAVLALVEASVSDPEDVEAAVKLAFQMAPREQWRRGYSGAAMIYSGGADAAHDYWVDYSRTEILEGPSAQGLGERTDEFKQRICNSS